MFYNKISVNTNDYKDKDKCYYDSCPSGRVSKLTNGVNLCVEPIDFNIININFTTVTCAASVQPISKPLIINVTTTIDQNTTSNKLTFKWSVTDIKQVKTDGTYVTLSDTDKLSYSVKLLNGVKDVLRTLKIPASNLVQDLEYTFKVVVSNQYKDIELTKSVIARKLTQQSKTLDSIGIDNKLITVTPERGLSGTQKFTAKYVYDNVKALKKCNDWKYTVAIIIPGSDKISMSS